MATPEELRTKSLADHIEQSDIEECIQCGGLSAYSWDLVDESEGIAHIGRSSCWEWQCGHCGADHVERDAPILHECYTHIPADEWETIDDE